MPPAKRNLSETNRNCLIHFQVKTLVGGNGRKLVWHGIRVLLAPANKKLSEELRLRKEGEAPTYVMHTYCSLPFWTLLDVLIVPSLAFVQSLVK